jgi:hypothetical protein
MYRLVVIVTGYPDEKVCMTDLFETLNGMFPQGREKRRNNHLLALKLLTLFNHKMFMSRQACLPERVNNPG